MSATSHSYPPQSPSERDAQSPRPTTVHRRASLSPPRRAPTLTYHNSRAIVLPTPEILGSVAGGAHYAGAFSTHEQHVHPAKLEKHRRSLSMNADDPMVSEAYRGVIQDLQEVRTTSVLSGS